MIENYTKVNLFTEFGDVKNIKLIDKIFRENNWQLLKSPAIEYYQLYFGKGVQVDNMYECGFPHLLNKDDTKKELERFIEYRLELQKKTFKEMEYSI